MQCFPLLYWYTETCRPSTFENAPGRFFYRYIVVAPRGVLKGYDGSQGELRMNPG